MYVHVCVCVCVCLCVCVCVYDVLAHINAFHFEISFIYCYIMVRGGGNELHGRKSLLVCVGETSL